MKKISIILVMMIAVLASCNNQNPLPPGIIDGGGVGLPSTSSPSENTAVAVDVGRIAADALKVKSKVSVSGMTLVEEVAGGSSALLKSRAAGTLEVTVEFGRDDSTYSNNDTDTVTISAGKMTLKFSYEDGGKISGYDIDENAISESLTVMTQGNASASTITAIESSGVVSGATYNSSGSTVTVNDVKASQSSSTTMTVDGTVVSPGAIATGNDPTTWDGKSVDIDWYEESTSNTYTISTAADLAGLAFLVNSGTSEFDSATVNLSSDIDLNNHPWTPIGLVNGEFEDIYNNSYDNHFLGFKGEFDGGSKTIHNLYIDGNVSDAPSVIFNDSFKGLFGIVEDGAEIKNLTIENVDITGEGFIGALVGYIPAKADNQDTVEGVKIADVDILGNISIKVKADAGGLVGRNEARRTKITISDCRVIGNAGSSISTIKTFNTSASIVGGLIGAAYSNIDNTIERCTVSIDVNGYTQCVGGIAGHFNRGKITDCKVSGDIYMKSAVTNPTTAWYYDNYCIGQYFGSYSRPSTKPENPTITISGCDISGASVRTDITPLEGEVYLSYGGPRGTSEDTKYADVSNNNGCISIS